MPFSLSITNQKISQIYKIRTDRIIILIYINFQFYRLNTVLIPPPAPILSKSRMHALTHLQLSLHSTPFSPMARNPQKAIFFLQQKSLVPFTGPIFFVLLPPTFNHNPNPTHILHISVSVSGILHSPSSEEEEEEEEQTDTELI